jgi:NAD(P)-dependent dehydrogenase (short-subunit alcohol dehydrogenase family)
VIVSFGTLGFNSGDPEVSLVNIDLTGKVALVTGAARGIGAATAEVLAKAGASVVLGDVLPDAVDATTKRLATEGYRVKAVVQDVTDEAVWESIVADTIAEFGSFDILVNNAGIEQTVFLSQIDETSMRRLLAVNVEGTLLGHKHAIRAMSPGGPSGRGGCIVNISSVAGIVGTAGLGVYSATKGAVRLLTKAAAVECGTLGLGIRVNSVHPGLIDTKMGNKLLTDYVALGVFPDLETAKTSFTNAHPIGRIGKPADIANAVLFLASDLASFMTGHDLVVDGGLTVT